MTPVLSFAVMVGLGLDYDVFLLTRIYEEREWDGRPRFDRARPRPLGQYHHRRRLH